MNINELAKEIHENAVNHGWWEEPRKFPEVAALIHSEISEALEEYRDGKPLVYGTCAICSEDCEHYGNCDTHDPRECKPEGLAVELADAIIRILDFTASEGIDIDAVIMAKHRYNIGRPYRHGGKRA